MLLDRQWTEPLPILAWVVEHSEGIIVIDTGESSRVAESGYFPRWHPYFHLGMHAEVSGNDEIGPQLSRLDIDPLAVRWVVMTHLHTDHAGGLPHFPNSDVLVTEREFADASGWRGRLRGYLNNRFPIWFAPRLVEFTANPFGPFPGSVPLTREGDVRLVPAPGHTPGHMAVLIEEANDSFVFVAGDSSYSQELMIRGAVDGVSPDDDVARQTLDRIRSFTESHRVVYLPSHDPESVDRLVTRAAVSGTPVGARARVAA